MVSLARTLYILIFSFCSATVHASILVEPYLGYELGSWEARYSDNLGGGSAEGASNATALGARLAYIFQPTRNLG